MTPPEQPARMVALWVDGALGWLERLCLTSALDAGHPVTLYTYGGVTGAPPGLDIADGRAVMPDSMLRRHAARGSWAISADLFRMRALERGLGVWTDCDVLFLRSLVPVQGCPIYGLHKPGRLNNAVLWLPPDSPLLAAWLAFFAREHIVPPWLPWRKRLRYAIRPLLRLRPLGVEEHRWGVTGPGSLTHFAKRLGLIEQAQPPEVFYPLEHRMAKDAFDPSIDMSLRITSRTLAVHLWNDAIRGLTAAPPPPRSFLDAACRRHGIAT